MGKFKELDIEIQEAIRSRTIPVVFTVVYMASIAAFFAFYLQGV